MNSQSRDKVGRSRGRLQNDKVSVSPVMGAVEGIGSVSYKVVLNHLGASDSTENLMKLWAPSLWMYIYAKFFM